MKQIVKFLIAAIIAVVPILSHAETVTLILKNGTTLVGELVSVDPTSVVEINLAGIVTKINFSDIEKIEKKEVLSTSTPNLTANLPKERIINIAGHDVKFVLVDGGTFTYGYDGPMSLALQSEPVHDITVSPFYVSIDPISKTMYNDINGTDIWKEYTFNYYEDKKDANGSKARQDMLNIFLDLALLGLANTHYELVPYDSTNSGKVVKDIPTVGQFIKTIQSMSLPVEIDLLSEAQWACIYKFNNKEVHFPTYVEAVRSINMTQSVDPNTVGYTTKGMSAYIHNDWRSAIIDCYDNRLSTGVFTVNKKKKQITYGIGNDILVPFHLVFPAK